jgi:hypothetical protein
VQTLARNRTLRANARQSRRANSPLGSCVSITPQPSPVPAIVAFHRSARGGARPTPAAATGHRQRAYVGLVETELIDSFERFRAAVARHNALADGQETDRAAILSSADAILVARVDFYQCLIRAGWTPPEAVFDLLNSDGRLATEADDRTLPDRA